jgi:hypothetical protein
MSRLVVTPEPFFKMRQSMKFHQSPPPSVTVAKTRQVPMSMTLATKSFDESLLQAQLVVIPSQAKVDISAGGFKGSSVAALEMKVVLLKAVVAKIATLIANTAKHPYRVIETTRRRQKISQKPPKLVLFHRDPLAHEPHYLQVKSHRGCTNNTTTFPTTARLPYERSPPALMFNVSPMARQRQYIPTTRLHTSFRLPDVDILEARKQSPHLLRLSSPLFDRLRPTLKMMMQVFIFEMLEAYWQIPP